MGGTALTTEQPCHEVASEREKTCFCLAGRPGADPGFLERGFKCIKVWGFALLIVSIP